MRSLRTASLTALTLLAAAVASTPRTASAQATTPVQHTVRHTLRGEVGAVTQVELSSPWRPTPAEFGASVNDPRLSARSWMHRASVRSNVRSVVMLEPAAGTNRDHANDGAGNPGNADPRDTRNLWHVRNANGELVAWQGQPVPLSHALEAGRHDIPIVWVAPPGATSPPNPVVRLRLVTDAR